MQMSINIQILHIQNLHIHTLGREGRLKLSVSNGNGSCNKEMWKPTLKKMLCAISLFEKMLVNPGNSGVPFCNLVFTRTVRVADCLSLSQVHLKRSGRNLKLSGSSSLHHTHTFSFMMLIPPRHRGCQHFHVSFQQSKTMPVNRTGHMARRACIWQIKALSIGGSCTLSLQWQARCSLISQSGLHN